MDRYIGLDVHSRSCTLAVVGPTGKRIKCEVLETNATVLIDALGRIPTPRHLCLEEGAQTAWLCEVLRPHVDELIVEAPRKRDRSSAKSDEADAWALAERLRAGTVAHSVFKAPVRLAGLRDAVRGHVMVVRDITRTKNRLRSVYLSRGVKVEEGQQIYDADSRPAFLAQLPGSSRDLASLLGDQLDALEAVREIAEARVLAEGADHPAVRRLQTAPGIGPIRAAQIVAVVVTPHRFRTTRQFWSYCGLGIVTFSSADWVRQGTEWIRSPNAVKTRGLTRRRQPLLKSVFKSAATTVIGKMPDHPWSKDFRRQCDAGTRPNLARVTLARRIAATTLAMWKREEDYDQKRHRLTLTQDAATRPGSP